MGICYYAIIGAGYIIDSEKADEIEALPNYEDEYSGYLHCLEPDCYDSNYFFGEIIKEVDFGCPEPVDTTNTHLVELLNAKRECGSVLNIDNEFDLDIYLMVRKW